jgi:hypothetical protein
MHTFFHGWRRKAGLVTLVMSCVLVAGWIRSFRFRDSIEFPSWQRDETIPGIASDNQSISWQFVRASVSYSAVPSADWFRWRFVTKYSPQIPFEVVEDQTVYGFGRKIEEYDRGYSSYTRTQYLVPYWAMVIPLTLLSAYLLLVPPPKQITTASRPNA